MREIMERRLRNFILVKDQIKFPDIIEILHQIFALNNQEKIPHNLEIMGKETIEVLKEGLF